MVKRFKLISEKCQKCRHKDRCLDEMDNDWNMQCQKSRYENTEDIKNELEYEMRKDRWVSGIYDTRKGPSFSVFDAMFWDHVIASFREWRTKARKKLEMIRDYLGEEWRIWRLMRQRKKKARKTRKGWRRKRRSLKKYIEEDPVSFIIDVFVIACAIALSFAWWTATR
jgi:hypothetical protein